MEDLHQLHEAHMSQLDPTDLVTYLLDCVPFLKTNDLSGWKARYQSHSPETTTIEPTTTCPTCHTNGHLVTDHARGSVVCSTCGTVVDATGLGSDVAHMSVDRIVNGMRHVVHRYSRQVYFRSFLASIQGITKPTNVTTVLKSLRATIGGNVNVDAVIVALRKLKLSTQYRRHATTLTRMLDPTIETVVINDKQLHHLLTMFHAVERYWDGRFKRSLKCRKSFFSYPYLLYQFAYHLQYPSLTQKRFLLKDSKLRQFQHYMYRQICNVYNWTCDIDC